MKKIKPLKKLKLNNDSMAKIIGGADGGTACEYDYCNVSSIDRSDPWKPPTNPPTDPPEPTCKCGCSGCQWEDGGAGFSLGMMNSNFDGYECKFLFFG